MNIEYAGMVADLFLMFFAGMLVVLQKRNIRSLWLRLLSLIIVLSIPLSTVFPIAEGFGANAIFSLLMLSVVGVIFGFLPYFLTGDRRTRNSMRVAMAGLAFIGIFSMMAINVFTSTALDFGFFAKIAATFIFSFFALPAYWGGYMQMKMNSGGSVYIGATIIMCVIVTLIMLNAPAV